MGRIRTITVARAEVTPEDEFFFNVFFIRVLVALAPFVKRLF